MPPHPTIYCRSSVKHLYGPYDLNFKISADYDAVLRLLSHNVSIAYLPVVMLNMRVGGNSNKLNHLPIKYLDDLRVLRKNGWGIFSAAVTLALKTVSKVPQLFFR